MHIVHVVTRMLRSGSEENTVETCRWQVKAGHKVTLIHGKEIDLHWQQNRISGVDLVSLRALVHPLAPVSDILACRALRALFRELQPDVIHTHQSKAGILGRLASTVVPDAVVVHGIHILPFEGVNAARRAVFVTAEKWAARHTDRFIGVSEAVGQAYVDLGLAKAENVSCVRSGFDLNRFEQASPPEGWRDLLNLRASEQRPAVALMLAAFEPRKRHVPFLRALAGVADALPDFRLLLAGAGPEEARVRAEVDALGLGQKVVFCGHRDDPEKLLALADVSILASEREGLPRVVIQSIAAGCPALVSRIPGIEEVIADGTNGMVLPGDDLAGLAQGLRKVLTNEAELQRLRAGARKTDVSDWSLSALGALTTRAYGIPAHLPQVAA